MAFQLTKAQKMIQALAKEFADNELSPVAAEMDKNEAMDPAILEKLGKLGFMGIGVPTEYGGAGFGMMEKSLMVTELAKQCASTAEVMSVHTMAITSIIKYGTPEQKEKYLTGSVKGWIAGFALTEPNAGSDAANVQTTAVLDGDTYVINGSKCFISNMGPNEGDFVTILALTDPSKGYKGMSTIIVDRGTPGFIVGKREEKLGIRAADVSELIFEDCRVPKANLLGAEGKGFKIFMEALDGGRVGMASQALGIAEEALRLSKDYLKVRVQFGKPLEKQQGLQWYVADMATKIAAARALIYEAAQTMDRGENATEIAAIAKYYASEMAVEVTNKALQIHSGYGYMRDYPLERMYRDARIIPIYEGTSEIQKNIIAREELKK
ncbi:acyl-CoA dehydrogenase [Oscillospiraceae bacterium]|nr:acyl-CoA dehydrogenase [Oscillospiraceae bacterium]